MSSSVSFQELNDYIVNLFAMRAVSCVKIKVEDVQVTGSRIWDLTDAVLN